MPRGPGQVGAGQTSGQKAGPTDGVGNDWCHGPWPERHCQPTEAGVGPTIDQKGGVKDENGPDITPRMRNDMSAQGRLEQCQEDQGGLGLGKHLVRRWAN